MNLEEIKAGDWIWINYMSFGMALKRYERVTRVTRTQIIAGRGIERRYYRQGGREFSGGSMTQIAGLAPQEEREAFDRDQAKQKEREEHLDKQEKALRTKFGRRKEFDLSRRGESYQIHFYNISHAMAQKIADALRKK